MCKNTEFESLFKSHHFTSSKLLNVLISSSFYNAVFLLQVFFLNQTHLFLFANKISVKLLSLHSSVVQSIQVQALPSRVENNQVLREGVGSDHFSDSNSSFLANEKLMSVDSMNSDLTGKSDL